MRKLAVLESQGYKSEDKVHIRKNNSHNQDRQECQYLIIFSEMIKTNGGFLPEKYLLYLLLSGITFVISYI